MIGLMGVDDQDMLITPSGRNLFRARLYILILNYYGNEFGFEISFSSLIQKIQHKIAKLTWKYD